MGASSDKIISALRRFWYMEFTYRQLRSADVADMAAIEAEALSSQERPDLLRPNGVAVLAHCEESPHLSLGAFVGEALAGFAVLYVPDSAAEDLSLSLTTRPCGKTANFKLCIVRPPYRGHGLQCALGRRLEAEARRQGIEVLCSTVSPYNEASRRSLERLGYQRDRQLQKYGFERLLYCKRLTCV